jgi:cytochrome c-type biogenesis protein CcmH/NrfF
VIDVTPLAHAGHWYHAVLYLAPVLLVVVALWLSSLRERRAERESEPADDA